MKTLQAATTFLLLSLLLTLPFLFLTNLAGPAAAAPSGLQPGTPRAATTTITVTTSADELNTDGDCSLREAVQAANTDTAVDACPAGTGPDTIVLPANTYTLSIGTNEEDANAEGDLDVTGVLTIAGAGNTATIIQGGTDEYNGIDRVFHVLSGGNLTIYDVTVRFGQTVNGSSPHINGGGIYVGEDGLLNLYRCTITHNAGSNGGGIATASGTSVDIDNSAISYNQGGSGGGGLDLGFNGTVHINNTTFHENEAAFGGGANLGGAIGTISNSTFSNNTALDEFEPEELTGYGGAIQNGGTTTITNTTISGNTAFSQGGGIRNFGTLIIDNSTLTGNNAPDGAGIISFSSGTITVTNSIIANNIGDDCSGTITSQGYNIAGDNSCALAGPGDMNNTDPLLAPLQDNGGPSDTHALQESSAAIDAGNNDACPATDQRGALRPVDGDGDMVATCDIGAFELGGLVGLAAINDSPTPLGQLTTLEATLEAGPGPVAFNWDLGDGTSAHRQTITHTYPAVGLYVAVVTATNPASTLTATTTIIVEEPLAGLTAVSNSPTVLGQATTLTATITAGTSVTYLWDFGDGTTGDGPYPSHTYLEAGEYTVVVTATNAVSALAASTTVVVDEPLAGLTAVSDSPTALGQATQLQAALETGTGLITFTWDFGDGETGQGQVVFHSYAAVGSYTAVLTATNAVSTLTASTTVIVEEPVAGLAATSDSPTVLGQATTLTATVTAGNNVSYLWSFGDGTMGESPLVTHTYPDPGEYTAVVTATNAVSTLTAATTTVTVDEPLLDLAATSDSPTALGQPTTLMATITTGSNITYRWDLGDGTTGGGQHVAHTYPATGIYTAVVTATNSVSALTATTTITVEEAVAGLIAISDAPTRIGRTTTFSATVAAGSNVTYHWDFGDTHSATGPTVTHTYATVGEYTVTITATNQVSSAIETLTVTITPVELHLPLIFGR